MARGAEQGHCEKTREVKRLTKIEEPTGFPMQQRARWPPEIIVKITALWSRYLVVYNGIIVNRIKNNSMTFLDSRTVILIGGMPTAGKSTVAQALSDHLSLPW